VGGTKKAPTKAGGAFFVEGAAANEFATNSKTKKFI
jgi:hypothetical protein